MKRSILFLLCIFGFLMSAQAENLDSLNDIAGWEYHGDIRTQKLKSSKFIYSQLLKNSEEVFTADTLGHIRIWNLATGKLRFADSIQMTSVLQLVNDSLLYYVHYKPKSLRWCSCLNINTGQILRSVYIDSIFSSYNGMIITYGNKLPKYYHKSNMILVPLYKGETIYYNRSGYGIKTYALNCDDFSIVPDSLVPVEDGANYVYSSSNEVYSYFKHHYGEDGEYNYETNMIKYGNVIDTVSKGRGFVTSFTRSGIQLLAGKGNYLVVYDTEATEKIQYKTLQYNLNEFVVDANDNIVSRGDNGRSLNIGGWNTTVTNAVIDLPDSVGRSMLLLTKDSTNTIIAGTSGVLMYVPLPFATEIEAKAVASRTVIYENEHVEFWNRTSGLTKYFKWIISDGAESSDYNFTYTFKQAGVYSGTLIAGDGFNADTVMYQNWINVRKRPGKETASYTEDRRFGYLPLQVQFKNTTDAAYSNLLWDFGDGTSSNEATPNHIFNQYGTYNVVLTAVKGSDTLRLSKEFNVISANMQGNGFSKTILGGGYFPIMISDSCYDLIQTAENNWSVVYKKRHYEQVNHWPYRVDTNSYYLVYYNKLDSIYKQSSTDYSYRSHLYGNIMSHEGKVYSPEGKYVLDTKTIPLRLAIPDWRRDNMLCYDSSRIRYCDKYMNALWEKDFRAIINDSSRLLNIQFIENGNIELLVKPLSVNSVFRFILNTSNGQTISKCSLFNEGTNPIVRVKNNLYCSNQGKEIKLFDSTGILKNRILTKRSINKVLYLDSLNIGIAYFAPDSLKTVMEIYDTDLNLLVTHIDSNSTGIYGRSADFRAFMLADKSIIILNTFRGQNSAISGNNNYYNVVQRSRWFFPDIYKYYKNAAEKLDSLNQYTGWEYYGKVRVQKLKTAPYSFSQVISNGTELMTADTLGYVRIWNMETGKLRYSKQYELKKMVGCYKDSVIYFEGKSGSLLPNTLYGFNIYTELMVDQLPLDNLTCQGGYFEENTSYNYSYTKSGIIYIHYYCNRYGVDYAYDVLSSMAYDCSKNLLFSSEITENGGGFYKISKSGSIYSAISHSREGFNMFNNSYVWLINGTNEKKVIDGFNSQTSFSRNDEYFLAGRNDSLYVCNTKDLKNIIRKRLQYKLNQFVVDTNDNMISINDAGSLLNICGWQNSLTHTEIKLPNTVGTTNIILNNDSNSVILAGSTGRLMLVPLINNTAIVAAFEANRTDIFEGEQVDFYNRTTGLTKSCKWIISDGFETTDYDFNYIFKKAGSYDVTLIASDDVKSDTAFRKYFIHVSPNIKKETAKFTENRRFGYLPLTVKFANTTAKPYKSIVWDFGDGTTSNEENPTHTFYKLGKYDILLKVFRNSDTLELAKEFNIVSKEQLQEDLSLKRGYEFNHYSSSDQVVSWHYSNVIPYNNGEFVLNLNYEWYADYVEYGFYLLRKYSDLYAKYNNKDTIQIATANNNAMYPYFNNGYTTKDNKVYNTTGRFLFDIKNRPQGHLLLDSKRDSIIMYNEQSISYLDQYFSPLWTIEYKNYVKDSCRLLSIASLDDGNISAIFYQYTTNEVVEYKINPEKPDLMNKRNLTDWKNKPLVQINDSCYYSYDSTSIYLLNKNGSQIYFHESKYKIDSVFVLRNEYLGITGSDKSRDSLYFELYNITFQKIGSIYDTLHIDQGDVATKLVEAFPVMLDDKSIVINQNWGSEKMKPLSFRQTRYFFPEIYKSDSSTSVTEPIPGESLVTAFPNPAHDELTIQFDTEQNPFKLEILNITGERVDAKIKSISDNGVILDLSMLGAGAYFYKIEAGERRFSGKFIKE